MRGGKYKAGTNWKHIGVLLAAAVIAALVPLSGAAAGPPSAEPDQPGAVRTSVSTLGVEAAGGDIHDTSISGSGRWAVFSGNATNLVANAPRQGLYRHDTETGATELVTVGIPGVGRASSAGDPTVSRDGRMVAFRSLSSNLVADDLNYQQDIFVRDMQLGTTTLISRDTSGAPGTARSDNPKISADGRHVVFESAAPNLVDGVTGTQVYIHHLDSGETELVSASTGGTPGDRSAGGDRSDITADGRYVAFLSNSNNLTQPTGGYRHVYVRDTVDGVTTHVTYDESYNIGNPSISPDGSLVGWDDAYHQRIRPRTGGNKTNVIGGSGTHDGSAFSADNRFLAKYAGGRPWLVDLTTGSVVEVAVTPTGQSANGGGNPPGPPSLSDDGRFVAFLSDATDLVANDTNGLEDSFVFDVGDILGPRVESLDFDPQPATYPQLVTARADISDVGRGASALTNVEYRADDGDWTPMPAEDGAWDSASEAGVAQLDSLSDGTHTVCVRASDARGNSGDPRCENLEYERPAIRQTVNVTVRRISNRAEFIDNESAPDFYARVLTTDLFIPTNLPDNRKGTGDDSILVEPDWEYPTTLTDAETATVLIEAWDDDDFLNGEDDLLDVTPEPGTNRLVVGIDMATGVRLDGGPNAFCSLGDNPDISVQICVSIEVSGTDADGDGIPNKWELEGIDVDRDGELELDLPAMGADPCRKTVITEIDWMDGAISWPTEGWTHEPSPNALGLVEQAYDNAPLEAAADCPFAGFPEKATGVDFVGYLDEEVPEQAVDFDVFDGTGALADNRANYFDERLLPWVHYGLYIHAKFVDPDDGTAGGTCCDDGSYQVSLGLSTALKAGSSTERVPFHSTDANPNERARREAATIMHEIGHALGLGHGGEGNNPNFKPNYMSIMNYSFSGGLWDDAGNSVIDYSREELPSVNEKLLQEGPLVTTTETPDLLTRWWGSNYDRVWSRVDGDFDWDADGAIDADPVSADLNTDAICVRGNDLLQTTPEGDDVVVTSAKGKEYIAAGPDRACATTAEETDSQKVEPGNTVVDLQLHEGHDDWAAVTFRGEHSMFGNAAHPVEVVDPPEPTVSELEETEAFWDEVIDEVTNTPPMVSGADPITLEANGDDGWSGDLEAEAGVSASDPDDGDSATLSNDAPDVLPIGTTTVNWTATDTHGESTTTPQEITVTAPEDPDPDPDDPGDDDGSDDPECTITGTAGRDVLIGTPGDDVICGLEGGDIIIGLAGDDLLLGDEGGDLIIGGRGNDEIRGGSGPDLLLGNAGDDKMFGDDGRDFAIGGRGNDEIHGGSGPDFLLGNAGDDQIFGDDGRDFLIGGPGTDELIGGQGNDRLIGSKADHVEQ